MSDDHDDLLNFDIADGEFADGTLNEDELLLSDEDRDDFEDELPSPSRHISPPTTTNLLVALNPLIKISEPIIPEKDTGQQSILPEKVENEPPQSVTATPLVEDSSQSHSIAPRHPFRQKFQRWPNQPPRWIPMGPQQQQMPFQRSQGPVMRPPGHVMMGPGPQRQMRPGFPPQGGRPPFFSNNFIQSRPPIRTPMTRQRFFYQNPPHMGGQMQGSPTYVPSPVIGSNSVPLPRKVLINPNFKGGVEAAKNQLMKDRYFSSSSMALPEDELLRKQQEFINHNMRQIEKRRHERTPSPEYRRGYSHSPSPPRYRRRQMRNYDRRRDPAGNDIKGKDENQPEEDEETRAYRQQIESQRRKREEILRQKEMRRKQQAEKAKETLPSEPLQPIIVTDKKIVLKRKTPEKSMTPPLCKEAPMTPTRRIVLKPSKAILESVVKSAQLADGTKRKIQKTPNS